MSDFERSYGDGTTYKTYVELSTKFTDEFNKLTFDLLVENYIRFEMLDQNLDDRTYQTLKSTWRSVALELGVLYDYPYNMNYFQNAHPLAREASIVSKKLLKRDA